MIQIFFMEDYLHLTSLNICIIYEKMEKFDYALSATFISEWMQ